MSGHGPNGRLWCTTAELAEWSGIHMKTLQEWRKPRPGKPRRGPRFLQEGRIVRYLWSDVYGWANDRRKAS